MIITIWKEINKPLVMPQELMGKIGGHSGKKISVIATKDRRVIMTRNPQKHDIKYQVEIGKNDDFVPTAALRAASFTSAEEFKVKYQSGELIITGICRNLVSNSVALKSKRILDI